METPVALSYVFSRLTDAGDAAWGVVYDEFFCFLQATWVHCLVHDGLFCRFSDQVVEWLDGLEVSQLADGPGGEERLLTYQRMRPAHALFPWTTVVTDVRRRDYYTKAALEVYVKLDPSAKYGFALRQLCGSFEWKYDASWSASVDSPGVRRPAGRGGRDSHRRARVASRTPSPPAVVGSKDRVVASAAATESFSAGGEEPVWPSEWARVGAVALLGADRVAAMTGRKVPRGPMAGALAVA